MPENDPSNRPDVISPEEFASGWDSERRVHELNPLTFHLRGSTMYVPARTKADMDDAVGAPTQAVKTRTFPKEFRVWIAPCAPNDPDARNLRPTTDTQGSAEFGFGIPLKKLHLKTPPTRQYTFEAKRISVAGGFGVIYEISFGDFKSSPRDLKPDGASAAKAGTGKKGRKRAAQKAGAAPEEEKPQSAEVQRAEVQGQEVQGQEVQGQEVQRAEVQGQEVQSEKVQSEG